MHPYSPSVVGYELDVVGVPTCFPIELKTSLSHFLSDLGLDVASITIGKLVCPHCKVDETLQIQSFTSHEFFTASMLQKEREAFKKEKKGKKFGHALLVRLQGKYNFKGRNMCLSADVKVA